MIIYLHFTSRKLSTKKGQRNKITGSPDINIPASTWECKIINNNNKFILYIYIKRKLLIKFRFTDERIFLKKGLSNLLLDKV